MLTPDVLQAIAETAVLPLTTEEAASIVGVNRSTWRIWRKAGERLAEIPEETIKAMKLEQLRGLGGEIGLTNPGRLRRHWISAILERKERYCAFCAILEDAQAKRKKMLLEKVRQLAEGQATETQIVHRQRRGKWVADSVTRKLGRPDRWAIGMMLHHAGVELPAAGAKAAAAATQADPEEAGRAMYEAMLAASASVPTEGEPT